MRIEVSHFNFYFQIHFEAFHPTKKVGNHTIAQYLPLCYYHNATLSCSIWDMTALAI